MHPPEQLSSAIVRVVPINSDKGLPELGSDVVPVRALKIFLRLFQFILRNLLISASASATEQRPRGRNQLFATATNPGAPPGGTAHHQGVVRDIVGDDRSGANHGPAPDR